MYKDTKHDKLYNINKINSILIKIELDMSVQSIEPIGPTI